MRTELEKLNGKTVKFTGVISAKGRIRVDNKHINTVCLIDVCDFKTNNCLTDHVWIRTNKFKGFSKGLKISFVAVIEPYLKRVNGEIVQDYCLSNVKYVKIL